MRINILFFTISVASISHVHSTTEDAKPDRDKEFKELKVPETIDKKCVPLLPKIPRPIATKDYYQTAVHFYRDHRRYPCPKNKRPIPHKDNLLKLEDQYITLKAAYIRRKSAILEYKIKQFRISSEAVQEIPKLDPIQDYTNGFFKAYHNTHIHCWRHASSYRDSSQTYEDADARRLFLKAEDLIKLLHTYEKAAENLNAGIRIYLNQMVFAACTKQNSLTDKTSPSTSVLDDPNYTPVDSLGLSTEQHVGIGTCLLPQADSTPNFLETAARDRISEWPLMPASAHPTVDLNISLFPISDAMAHSGYSSVSQSAASRIGELNPRSTMQTSGRNNDAAKDMPAPAQSQDDPYMRRFPLSASIAGPGYSSAIL